MDRILRLGSGLGAGVGAVSILVLFQSETLLFLPTLSSPGLLESLRDRPASID